MSSENNDKLLHAFKALRENVRHIWHNTEEKTFPEVKQALQQAEERWQQLMVYAQPLSAIIDQLPV